MRNAFRLFLLLPLLPLLPLLAGGPASVAAQGRAAGDSLLPIRWAGEADHAPRKLGALHVGLALGAVALLSVADEPLRDEFQASRTAGGDDLARAFRHFGEPVVYAPAVLGTVAVGLLAGRPSVTRAGGRIAGGLLVAGLATNLLKPLPGRRRPRFSEDAFALAPFTGQDSWPSGHAAMAFALATGVGDEIGSLPVSIGLYGVAGLTAWSRLNDNRHWLSDVAAGALIGVTGAKVMNGRWRLLGAGAPGFLLEPGRVGVTLRF